MSYLSCEFVQRILNYHWSLVSRYYVMLFLSFFCSMVMIVVNVSLLQAHPDYDSLKFRTRWCLNILNVVLTFASVVVFEARHIIKNSKSYFKDLWNLNDLFFVVWFYATLICDWVYGTEDKQGLQIIRIMYVVLIVTTFLRFLNLSRVFNRFSFIIQMIFNVIYEIKHFMSLFLLFTVTFAVCVNILGIELDPALINNKEGLTHDTITADKSENPYYGLLIIMQVPMYVLNTSLGTFNCDPFRLLPPVSRVTMWLLWVVIVFINTIVFMNFLIAVISDVYAQTMQTRTEEVFQKKA